MDTLITERGETEGKNMALNGSAERMTVSADTDTKKEKQILAKNTDISMDPYWDILCYIRLTMLKVI